jgi:hypothetical protein
MIVKNAFSLFGQSAVILLISSSSMSLFFIFFNTSEFGSVLLLLRC